MDVPLTSLKPSLATTAYMPDPQVTPFPSILIHCNVDEKEKKKKSRSLRRPLCRVCTFPCVWKGFLRTPASSHISKMCTWGEGVPPSSLCEWAWVWVCVALHWRDLLLRVVSALCPELLGQARITGHSEMEQAGWKIIIILINSSFLSVCIAHIYFNVEY